MSNKIELPYQIKVEELEELLGRQVSRNDMTQQDNPPGVVTGLAWTPVGGEILFIEVTGMPGRGEVTLTGKLGDVMKESARISLSLLRSRLPLDSVNFKERDLHIHVPSGADTDKFVDLDLKWEERELVNAQILMGGPINIECRVADSIIPLSHEMFVGKIETVHVNEEYLDRNGNIL